MISRRLKRRFRYAVFLASLVASALFALPGFAAAGDSNPPERIVRAIRQGSEIEFLGEIGYGAAAELSKVLAANPHATVLHLNSPGGDISEARQMAPMVSKRGLITTVDKSCYSACTLVFLAGRQRIIAPGAAIGFHRPTVAGMSSAEIDSVDQPDRQYMRDLGIPAWFIDKAFATPSSTIWVPTETELTSAHVITGVSTKYVIAVGKYRTSVGDDVYAAELFLEAAKKRNPERYRVVHAEFLRQLQSGSTGSDPVTDHDFELFLDSFVAHSEDRPVAAFLQIFSRVVSRLAAQDVDLCYDVLFPARAPQGFDASVAIGPDDEHQLTFALLRAAMNGAQNDLPVPTEDQAALPFAAVMAAVRKAHPEDMPALSDTGSLTMNHGAVCTAHAHFFAQIVSLPLDQQGLIGRFMAASESHETGGHGSSSASTAPFVARPRSIHPDK